MKIDYKDIVVGLFLLAGIAGFVSGEFILSSALFACAAVVSNIFGAEPHQENWPALFEWLFLIPTLGMGMHISYVQDNPNQYRYGDSPQNWRIRMREIIKLRLAIA